MKGESMTNVDWMQRAPGRWRADIGEWVLLVSDAEGGGFVWEASGGDFYFDGAAQPASGTVG